MISDATGIRLFEYSRVIGGIRCLYYSIRLGNLLFETYSIFDLIFANYSRIVRTRTIMLKRIQILFFFIFFSFCFHFFFHFFFHIFSFFFFFCENGVISRITQPYIIREYPVIRKILFGRISEVFVFEPYSICIIRIRTVFDFLVFVTSLLLDTKYSSVGKI